MPHRPFVEPLSFRITRNTEGLAETLATLSQRLVKLEQRMAGTRCGARTRDERARALGQRDATSLMRGRERSAK